MTLALLALAGWAGPAAAAPLETPVKAAFLTRFGAFASWPRPVLAANQPLRLCVLASPTFTQQVIQAAADLRGASRPMQVIPVSSVGALSACHVLYIGQSGNQTTAQALQAVRGASVLTVTDSAAGPARGAIHFVIFEDRVRFHIDLAQAERQRVGLNAKLLNLALTVSR